MTISNPVHDPYYTDSPKLQQLQPWQQKHLEEKPAVFRAEKMFFFLIQGSDVVHFLNRWKKINLFL